MIDMETLSKISSLVLSRVCSELDLTDTTIEIDNSVLPSSDICMMASVKSIGLFPEDEEDDDSEEIFREDGTINDDDYEIMTYRVKHDSVITIYPAVIKSFLDDLYSHLKKQNEDIYKNIEISLLENAIIHECRHLYQYNTRQFIDGDEVEIEVDHEQKTFGFVLNADTKNKLERDAIDYTISKKWITIISDQQLKNLYTNLEYFNILGDKVEALECFDRLNSYIRANY